MIIVCLSFFPFGDHSFYYEQLVFGFIIWYNIIVFKYYWQRDNEMKNRLLILLLAIVLTFLACWGIGSAIVSIATNA